ncbi:MAG: PaaI family thioesterase [Pygmaiobacter massiliensis]|nr:PaaI family thioesterase [Pygmaiobacter massiliensis]
MTSYHPVYHPADPAEKQAMQAHIVRQLNYTKEQCQDAIIGMIAPQFEDCDPARRSLTLSFTITSWMRNVGRTMHGGLISTAFDTSFGLLTNYYSRGHFITTTNLSITYLEPVFPGEKLVITVKANRAGRTLVGLTGKAWAVQGEKRRLADTATATFMILQEKFTPPWAVQNWAPEPDENPAT